MAKRNQGWDDGVALDKDRDWVERRILEPRRGASPLLSAAASTSRQTSSSSQYPRLTRGEKSHRSDGLPEVGRVPLAWSGTIARPLLVCIGASFRIWVRVGRV
jgi:hypothetical protein